MHIHGINTQNSYSDTPSPGNVGYAVSQAITSIQVLQNSSQDPSVIANDLTQCLNNLSQALGFSSASSNEANPPIFQDPHLCMIFNIFLLPFTMSSSEGVSFTIPPNMSSSAMQNLIKGILTELTPLQTSQQGAATWAPCNSNPPPYPASLKQELVYFMQPSGAEYSLYDMFDQTFPNYSLATILRTIINQVIPSIAPNISDQSIQTLKSEISNPVSPFVKSNDWNAFAKFFQTL
jgi:hypothetical protein